MTIQTDKTSNTEQNNLPENNQRQHGSVKKVGAKEWDIVIWRVPTQMTQAERDFSRQCASSFPPTVKKRNYHPISAAQMLRCPLGGGTCGNSLINTKDPKGAIYSHFSIHHRTGDFYNIKLEGSYNHFLYTTFPSSSIPSDTQHEGTFESLNELETAGAARRRQRLYPRLAGRGGKQNPTTTRVPEPTVEELLFGNVTAPGMPDETAQATALEAETRTPPEKEGAPETK